MKLLACALFSGMLGAGCTSANDGTLQIAACPGPPSDPFELGTATVNGEQLSVDVRTSGCAKHTFSVCWDGAILDSASGQIVLQLSHDAHGDTCDTQQTSTLQIDLSPVMVKFAPPWIARVAGADGPFADYDSVFVPGP
jgi:hypothetical protein